MTAQADAQRRLEDHLSPVPVHAGQFRRQDRGRPRRRADQGRAASSSPEQFGFLGSSFFFLFSISAIVVGFIVNRVDTRWVLLAMAVVWSLAQFPMVGTVSFTTLVICRIILGAGEGPAFAVAAHAIYKWFPDEKRTLPTAILSQGSAFGVILAVPALNWIIVNHSWHYAFGALGVVGLMWVVAWLVMGKEGPLVQTAAMAAADPRVPYFQLLTSRTFIGCCAADLRRLLGAVARADLVHAPSSSRDWASRKRMPGGFRCCPGCSAPPSCC